MSVYPINIGPAGPVPQTPSSMLAALLAGVSGVDPDYTANLPGTLIEDIAATDVSAALLCDSAFIELLNSVGPNTANPYLLTLIGNLSGMQIGALTNTSVNVVFSGPAGLIIGQGFTVSDGTYQYQLINGGIIGTGGTSLPLLAIATQQGSWPIAPNAVVNLVTSPPPGISPSLTVTNPEPGTPGGPPETQVSYQARVMQAHQAVGIGGPKLLKTLLQNLPGAVSRLVGIRQPIPGGQWEVVCGGSADPVQIAYAIYSALGMNFTTLIGSTLDVSGITNANPGVVTTNLNHGFATGQVINIAGVTGMSGVNNMPLTITVITPTTFSIGVNTTSLGTWTGGGVVTPNFRNIVVAISDYPDTYSIPYVSPPLQTVTMTVLWNTTAVNFVNVNGVAQLGSPAIVNYINSLPVGTPINLLDLEAAFQAAVSSILPPQQLTRMAISVSIDGVGSAPISGTFIIPGDPESYFLTNSSLVNISQG